MLLDSLFEYSNEFDLLDLTFNDIFKKRNKKRKRFNYTTYTNFLQKNEKNLGQCQTVKSIQPRWIYPYEIVDF